MTNMISILLPIFLLIGAGYVSTRSGFLKLPVLEGTLTFAQNVALPCLLFRAVSTFNLGAEFHLPLLVSFYAGAIASFLLGWLGARAIGRPAEDSVIIGFCCLFSNSMMLGVPITERVFGTDALNANFAIIAVHSPICYTIGIVAMEVTLAGGQGLAAFALAKRIAKQMLTNPLVLALVLGFAVNLTGLGVPAALGDSLDMLGRAALPIALFAVGGVLVQYKIEGDWRLIGMICGLGLLVHPAITFGLGKAFHLDDAAFRSAVITAGTAPGINTYVFANLYGVGKRSAASSLLISTAICLFTLSFWISILP